MKDKLQKKLVIPLVALAIVGLGGTVYTISHAGPTTASAQTAISQHAPDGETQDDSAANAVKPSTAVDKPDANESPNSPDKDANLPGGGHQDAPGADNQAEGVK